MILTETWRSIGTQREVGIVELLIVILATHEEWEVRVIWRRICPAAGTCTWWYIGQEVAGLTLGIYLETLWMEIDSLLTQHHVERMDIVQGETVVSRSGLCQVDGITALTSRSTLSVIWRETWERLEERCRMGEIGTELSTDSQILYRIDFSIHGREHLIFLVLDRIHAHVNDRVLAGSCPVACSKWSQTAILCVWIPVRQHESACWDRSNGSITAVISLLSLLVGSHGVGTYLQPLACLYISIGADVVTAEGWILCDTVLIVETTRNIVVQAVGSTVDREFVALQRSSVVEHLVQPVYVYSWKEIVILTCIQTYFFLKLDTLVGIHHFPVGLCQLRETILCTERNLRLVHCQASLGSDDNHTIGSTCTIDRGRRGIFQYRDTFDVVRTQGIEIWTWDRHAVEDKEWRLAGVDRVGTTDLEGSRLARFTRRRDDLQTGTLSLQSLVEACRRHIFYLFRLYGRHGTRNGSLLSHTIRHHNHFVHHLGIRSKGDVERVSLRFHYMLLRNATHIRVGKRSLRSTLNFDGIVTVNIGHYAIWCSLLHNGHTNHRFVVFSRHDCTLDAETLRQDRLDRQQHKWDK